MLPSKSGVERLVSTKNWGVFQSVNVPEANEGACLGDSFSTENQQIWGNLECVHRYFNAILSSNEFEGAFSDMELTTRGESND